jgi:hypothetical protein
MTAEETLAELANYRLIMDKFYHRLTVFVAMGFVSGFIAGLIITWTLIGEAPR